MRKFDKQPAEPGHVIGFTEKYYTWWIVSEPYTMTKWYGSQVIQDFIYQQNLSFEKDKAVEKMENNPDVDEFRIDETLKAKTSYQWEISSIDYNPDVFLFGKYKEQKFKDVDDTSYKRWYWEQTSGTEKESEVLRKDLENQLVEYNDELIFIDKLKDRVMEVYEENFRKKGLFGNEGDKFKSFVRFRKKYGFDTVYGWMHVYEFVDQKGRLFYYKGSKELELEKNIIYLLEGKIKHNTYWSKYHNEQVNETQIQWPKITPEKEL